MNQLFCQNKKNPENEVFYKVRQSSDLILINFQITNYTNKNLNYDFSTIHPKYNWGLWEYDVVEFFLQTSTKEYYEFQCSPLNQKFQLKVLEPRKVYATPLNIFFQTSVTEIYNTLEIELKISKEIIQESSFKFGCFACLGKNQALYTHHNKSLEIIDFHLPALFIRNI